MNCVEMLIMMYTHTHYYPHYLYIKLILVYQILTRDIVVVYSACADPISYVGGQRWFLEKAKTRGWGEHALGEETFSFTFQSSISKGSVFLVSSLSAPGSMSW